MGGFMEREREREVGSVGSLIMALLSVAAEPPGAASLRHRWRGQE